MATQITLPKDAEGREIPLDTSELFISDGTMVHAVRFEFIYHTCDARGTWFVYITSTPGEHMTLQACDVYLTPPDSWKQLEEDLNNGISGASPCCAYAGSKTYSCDKCCFESARYCTRRVFTDIRNRIRKLRGEG